MKNLDCINTLINCFTRLPGVGYKTAERYAYRIVESDKNFTEEFCAAIREVKNKVRFCDICGNFSTESRCNICQRRGPANPDPASSHTNTICVVKDPRDVLALEKSGAFRGTYHVLHGVISPLDKKGPDDINLKSLMVRLREESPAEVIIATNPDVEGEATANYIAALIKPLGIRVTRIARGLALGTNLEYADEVTLTAAIQNRTAL